MPGGVGAEGKTTSEASVASEVVEVGAVSVLSAVGGGHDGDGAPGLFF